MKTRLLVVGLTLGAGPMVRAQDLVVANVRVFAPATGRLTPGQSVIVRNGAIAWVGPSNQLPSERPSEVLDGRGGVLMPGLVDAHAHVESADFPRYLAAGVTSVRDLNGTPERLDWRRALLAGTRSGPNLVVSGPMLAGVAQRWRHRLITAIDTARVEVDAEAALGYDLVKVYDGLSPAVYDTIVATARRHRLPITGHLPEGITIEHALAAGQREFEHANQIVGAAGGHQADSAAIGRAVQLLAASNAIVTPTLASLEALSATRTAWYAGKLARGDSASVDPGIFGWWRSLLPRSSGADTVAEPARANPFYRRLALTVRELSRAGVRLRVGTDSPNPLMFPGGSVHEEIRALLEAGLPPLVVLQAATRSLTTGEPGSVAVGQPADLIVVRTNPLDDPGTLRDPVAVIVRGRRPNAAPPAP